MKLSILKIYTANITMTSTYRTIAERILIECGVGCDAVQELISLVREDRIYAAWNFFQIICPDKTKRANMVKTALTKYAIYKKGKLDDTSALIEKCLLYVRNQE
jgi:hypothetical protein